MNKRQLFHIALLFLPPLIIYLTMVFLFHDSYLAIIVSYIVLLVILQFVALEDFLLFPHLQELWRTQSESTKRFVFEGAEFRKPSIKVAPRVVLSDANLYNLAKLKYLVAETGSFIPSMRDDFKRLIFLNIFLLVFLMIISPQKNGESKPANDNTERPGIQAKVADSDPGANVTSERAIKDTPSSRESIEELLRTQGRLTISYFAVVLQLIWIGRLAFHYRQKNADLYFQTTAT